MFHENNWRYSGTNVSMVSTFSSTPAHDFELNGFKFIPEEEIEFSSDVLGHGSFGYVKKARWKGQVVAVKFQMVKEFQIEAEQLAKIKHDNIITVYGHSVHSDNHVIVMEYAEGGCLANLLSDPEYRSINYSYSHAISWCLQCARGVHYLHSMKPKSLIHRDLKPLNLLLSYDGLTLKICDFGTACDKKTFMTNNKGISAWMAPEVFKGIHYSEKCDVFSWAIILWQCLSRRQPFHKYDNEFAIQWAKGALGKKPPMLRNCPSKLKYLLTKCWDQEPTVRLSMNEIVPEMEDIFAHCNSATLTPLKLVPVRTGKVIISNVQSYNNTLTNSNSNSNNSNNSNSFNRRISDDNLVSRDTLETKTNLGHKRSSSSDASLILGDRMAGTVRNGADNLAPSDENGEVIDETISGLLRNFNAYLVLEERHYPVQPDIKNSESISIFEEHRQLSVKLLRLTFEIARLESYLKELQRYENDPNRDDNWIYMRMCDDNRQLKKLRAGFVDKFQPRSSRSNSNANGNALEVGNGWIMVERPNGVN